MNTDDAAAELGIQPNTLRRYVRERGCPHGRDEEGRGCLRFDVAEVRAWMDEKGLTGKPGRPSAEPTGDAKERKAHYDAEIARLKMLKLEGQLIERAEVERGRLARIAAVRQGLLNQPRRSAGILFAAKTERDLEALWTDMNRELLNEFADGAYPDAGGDSTGHAGVDGGYGFFTAPNPRLHDLPR